MAVPAKTRLTYAEYLQLERETGLRHEFLGGLVYAMAGGTIRRSRLKLNLAVAVDTALGDGPCLAYDSDLKVRIDAEDASVYPDLTVICGDPERATGDRYSATNPTVVFEVLSDSTEAWDRGGKRLQYAKLPNLKEYVLVDHRQPRVEVYTRTAPDVWEHRVFEAGQHAKLSSIGVQLPVDRRYRNLPPPAEDPALLPNVRLHQS